ncbi:hypothetical protein DENSPDRAFT_749755, partial [Dentipellis sp. KUC8613]
EEKIVVDWEDGVDEYKNMTEDELWEALGLAEKKQLPFFNAKLDPLGVRHPWDEDQNGAEWIEKNGEAFTPRWHQLVGILKMLENAFAGRPILQMDDVGLGKTLQTIGTIMCLAWFRTVFEEHKRFPGRFAHRKWQGTGENIPNLPHMIIVPTGLVVQVMHEIYRYLQPKSVDALPYTG